MSSPEGLSPIDFTAGVEQFDYDRYRKLKKISIECITRALRNSGPKPIDVIYEIIGAAAHQGIETTNLEVIQSAEFIDQSSERWHWQSSLDNKVRSRPGYDYQRTYEGVI
jgi:hypothetical protein